MHRVLPTVAAPRLSALLPEPEEAGADENLRRALADAIEEEALLVLEDALTGLLAHVLQTTPERIDRGRRFDQLGLDSLMGVELADLVAKQLGCGITAMELATAGDVTGLARRILPRLRHHATPTPSQ